MHVCIENNLQDFWNIDLMHCTMLIFCFSAITGVRLTGGQNFGRVEVFLAGPNEWGTVCDDYWDDLDATVVCRQLGYKSGVARKSGQFGLGTGPIWLDNVNCQGTEKSIADCTHNGFNIQNCNHMEDAGVICSGRYIKGLPQRQVSNDFHLSFKNNNPGDCFKIHIG